MYEGDGKVDPTVVAIIVENWRTTDSRMNGGGTGKCNLYSKDLPLHRQAIQAMFVGSRDTLMGLLASLLAYPTSSVRVLLLNLVSAGPESGRELASMLKTNKSKPGRLSTYLHVSFDSNDWIVTVMVRVMRETN